MGRIKKVALRPALERYLATHEVDVRDRSVVKDVGTPVPVSPVSDPVTFDEPVAAAPDTSAAHASVAEGDSASAYELGTSTGALKDASVSIFANELSDDAPRSVAVPSSSSNADRPDLKVSKGKSGKKKKGKKGKRAKA